MAIPTYDLFIEPILRFLAKHPEGVPAKMVHDAAADALGLSTEEKAQMLTSGTQQIYKNRAGWAHDLCQATSRTDPLTTSSFDPRLLISCLSFRVSRWPG